MASALFKIGTATTNSAGTTWSYRTAGVQADIQPGSYVKLALDSTTGVGSVNYTIFGADPSTSDAGLPTVTVVQASKTATFLGASTLGHTYLVKCQINSGQPNAGESADDYEKRLAVHIKTAQGNRLIADGETDEYNATHGYTSKLNSYMVAGGGGVSTYATMVTSGSPLVAAFSMAKGYTYLLEGTVLGFNVTYASAHSYRYDAVVQRTVDGTSSVKASSAKWSTIGTIHSSVAWSVSGAYAKLGGYSKNGVGNLSLRIRAMSSVIGG